MISYKSEWNLIFSKDQDDLAEILELDPFEDWEKNRNPEGTAADDFYDGLSILYSGSDTKGLSIFLKEC